MSTAFPSHFRDIACAILFAALPAAAQWLHYPTPGIPRTSDGKTESLGAHAAHRRRSSGSHRHVA